MGPDERLHMLMRSVQADTGAARALIDYLDEEYGDIRKALAMSDQIRGVGVLRIPFGNPSAEHWAIEAAQKIRIGSVLILPSGPDFDFTIIAGNPEQVIVERSDP